jgi:hypothetical protein
MLMGVTGDKKILTYLRYAYAQNAVCVWVRYTFDIFAFCDEEEGGIGSDPRRRAQAAARCAYQLSNAVRRTAQRPTPVASLCNHTHLQTTCVDVCAHLTSQRVSHVFSCLRAERLHVRETYDRKTQTLGDGAQCGSVARHRSRPTASIEA